MRPPLYSSRIERLTSGKSRYSFLYDVGSQYIFKKQSILAFLIALLFIVFSYRFRLILSLYFDSIHPFNFSPEKSSTFLMISDGLKDLLVVAGIFLIAYLFYRLLYRFRESGYWNSIQIAVLIAGNFVLLLFAFIHVAHYKLLFAVQTGLSSMVLREALNSAATGEVAAFASFTDLIYLFLPLGLFWFIRSATGMVRIVLGIGKAVIVGIILFSSLVGLFITRQVLAGEIRNNPAQFLMGDVLSEGKQGNYSYPVSNKKLETKGLQLISSDYIRNTSPIKFVPLTGQKKWNVVLFIMESVGSRYMFDTGRNNPVPMPFLKDLAEKSWFFKKHYTSANISSRAVFSLLSGLHDYFKKETFGTGETVVVPSLNNFLGKDYHSVLMTPASLYWYFPRQFITNSGITEVHSLETLRFKIKEEVLALGHYIARDEVQTVDFFTEKLKTMPEPFLGIYISFVAHYPYFDYGEQYRIIPKTADLVNRYYNNLYMLDCMLKKVYDTLRDKGLLERTILVIAGDHGQAFGQHKPNNYMHFRYCFNENLETPLVIHQPRIFRPRQIDFPTSHVDVLPTLLDAMRIPYNPSLLQGESVFQNQLRRKYLFFWGFRNMPASLSANNIKLIYYLNSNRCAAYDLNKDPGETTELSCDAHMPQLTALQNFAVHHNSALMSYNSSLNAEKSYMGERHPSVLKSVFNKRKKRLARKKKVEHVGLGPGNRQLIKKVDSNQDEQQEPKSL